jgi:hypothetical protein
MTVLTGKPVVERIDAALLAKELTESTLLSTLLRLARSRKTKDTVLIDVWMSFYNDRGFIFIPGLKTPSWSQRTKLDSKEISKQENIKMHRF